MEEPNVLPGLSRSELTETISTAVVFSLVAALIWPLAHGVVQPAAERLWRGLIR